MPLSQWPEVKGKVGLEWFASNLIASRGKALSAVLFGCGCANRLYRKVTTDASEIGRKSGKISTIPPFCNWLISDSRLDSPDQLIAVAEHVFEVTCGCDGWRPPAPETPPEEARGLTLPLPTRDQPLVVFWE